MRCIIVGDGPSAAGFQSPHGVTVIAVKRTINWLSRADYWFSLDYNADAMAIMRRQLPGVLYYCAAPRNVRLPHGVIHLHRVEFQGIEPTEKQSPEWWLWRWGCVLGLSEKQGAIHTGNSAYGALGLAYLKGYRDVLLVGVDGTQDARQSDGKTPNNLSHLPLLFRSALGQVNLATVGTMEGIPHTTLADWLASTSTN